MEQKNITTQKKAMGQYGDQKQARFGSPEFLIVVIVLVVIVAVAMPMLNAFIKQSRTAQQQSNAYNIFVATSAALTMGQFDEPEQAAFLKKYATFQPIGGLKQGTMAVEQNIAAYLSTPKQEFATLEEEAPPEQEVDLEGYVKITFTGPQDVHVWVAETQEGSNAQQYP